MPQNPSIRISGFRVKNSEHFIYAPCWLLASFFFTRSDFWITTMDHIWRSWLRENDGTCSFFSSEEVRRDGLTLIKMYTNDESPASNCRGQHQLDQQHILSKSSASHVSSPLSNLHKSRTTAVTSRQHTVDPSHCYPPGSQYHGYGLDYYTPEVGIHTSSTQPPPSSNFPHVTPSTSGESTLSCLTEKFIQLLHHSSRLGEA